MTNPYMVGPDYTSLSNVELIVDATGLTVGATNDYGTVDGSGNVTNLKSLTPGPTGRDFPSNGTAPTLSNGAMVFGGSGRLRHATASTWNFMHFNATPANMKYTIHIVAAPGTSSNPDAAYGFLGNNAASFANKGFSLWFDDRSSLSRNEACHFIIGQGGGNITFNNRQDLVIVPNKLQVITIEVELSHTNAYKQRTYINGALQSMVVTYTTTAMVTTPTFSLDIGGTGNGVLNYVGSIREIVIQSTVETGDIRTRFINGLIVKHSVPVDVFSPTVDTTQTIAIYDTYQEAVGKYYLEACLDQHPSNRYIVVGYFADGEDHYNGTDTGRKVSFRKSTNYGLSWGAKADLYDAPGSLLILGVGGGYANSGRLHVFTDQHGTSGSSVTTPHSVIYIYSDDDGATTTTVDLTAVINFDGLATVRVHGNMIDNFGALMIPYYTQTDEGVVTQSGNYLLRSTDGGLNWTSVTVRAKGTDYINESTIIALDNTRVMQLSRNEVTKEWTQYLSSDNGLTWSLVGQVTFGESLTTAGPLKLVKFRIESTDVIAAYYCNRDNSTVKVSYATAAALISSGTSAWISSTTLINTGRRPHYFDVIHPTGNMDAIMLSPYEKNPLDLSNNDLITAVLPSTHYSTVKTALGL